MAKIYVSIGSNIDKHFHIPKVLTELRKQFGVIEVSPIYQSAAVGFEGEDFFNLVVGLKTTLSPYEVYDLLRQLEADHKRTRTSVDQFVSRTLDLDQLLYDELQRNNEKVIIPSPDIMEYAFVLKPLVDIAAEVIHPTLKVSIQELWQEFEKDSVELVPVELETASSLNNLAL